MALGFRGATPADLGALVAIDTWGMRYAGRDEAISHWIGTGGTHVAERDGRIVAYGVLRPIFFLQPFIEALMVAADVRRSGVGGAMISHLDGLHGTASSGPRPIVRTRRCRGCCSASASPSLGRSRGWTRAIRSSSTTGCARCRSRPAAWVRDAASLRPTAD